MEHPITKQLRDLLKIIAKDVTDLPDDRDEAATHKRGPRILQAGNSVQFTGVRYHLKGGAAEYKNGSENKAVQKHEPLRLTCYLSEVSKPDPSLMVLEFQVSVPLSHEERPTFDLKQSAYDPVASGDDPGLRARILELFQEAITQHITPHWS